MPETGANAARDRQVGVRELLAVIVLSITAVLTAWSGFEASKWGGEMSIAFSRASGARSEASRSAAEADAARTFDLTVFGVYVQAVAEGDDVLRQFVETRFTDHFAVAFDAWVATSPLEDPDAPKGPFAMPEYRPPGEAEAADADARADALFADALENNQRGDDYTLLTVLFALVLFFAAISQRPRSTTLAWVVLGFAVVLLLVGVGLLISFPKII
ncbi:hypothetical protein [Jiangella anatolica]|uniref:Uncharacterized protein n=1 Tax=Jiangella anatolica TaxID=2670374 RepID=A0A2W2BQ74_9ACTN|nr:hypothetical protein [Jiangella anatolica]PZF82368.1 hypothetical protein C1I92_17230 [Jiangella anatolica]